MIFGSDRVVRSPHPWSPVLEAAALDGLLSKFSPSTSEESRGDDLIQLEGTVNVYYDRLVRLILQDACFGFVRALSWRNILVTNECDLPFDELYNWGTNSHMLHRHSETFTPKQRQSIPPTNEENEFNVYSFHSHWLIQPWLHSQWTTNNQRFPTRFCTVMDETYSNLQLWCSQPPNYSINSKTPDLKTRQGSSPHISVTG